MAVNVEATGKHLVFALDVTEDSLYDIYNKAEECVMTFKYGFSPVEVPAEEAPCKEVIINKEDIDLYSFPSVTHNIVRHLYNQGAWSLP